MQPASSARSWQLYERFAELRPLARSARLERIERVRERDPALARELEELLRADDRNTGETNAGFLEAPALEGQLDLAEVMASVGAQRSIPERIGRYRILGVLGEGGMGIVCLAEQESPRRTVALKVLKSELATPSRLKRFEHEAELLGRLHHPGIAQVFEAGAADAGGSLRPFIAMELVEGTDLRAFTKSRGRDLSVRERLLLLVRICEAVAHAHQKGVVHRDLKPENVLVDALGRPKVLDFGVARLVGKDSSLATLHTKEGAILGTPCSMSPEQLAGDPDAADTRSDVYALGLIGYELFAGRPPHDLEGKPLAEVARIIRDEEPAPVRRWNRELPADLETVIGKSLEKDPARRYASASELAADLMRVVEDQPISAKPPSGSYLLRKFVRRHQGLAAGIGAAALALFLGAVVFAVQAVRIARALDDTDRERTKFEASFKFLGKMLRSVDPARDGHDVRVADLLARGSRELAGAFPDDPAVEADLRRSLGTAWRALGEPEEALAELRAGLELLENVGADASEEIDVARNDVALVLKELGRLDEAEPLFRSTLEHQRAALGPHALDTLVTLSNLAQLLAQRGDLVEAERYYRETLGSEEGLGDGANPEMRETSQRLFLSARRGLAGLLENKGELEEARTLLETALADARASFGDRDPDALAVLNNLGSLEASMGELERAIAHLEESFAGFAEKLPPGHPNLLALENNLGTLLGRAGRVEESEQRLRKAFEGRRELFGPDHLSTLTSGNNLAGVLVTVERYEEAESLLREVLAGLERQLAPEHWMPNATNLRLAECLMRVGRLDEAEERLERSYANLGAALGPNAEKTKSARALLIELHEMRGNLERANALRGTD